MTERLDNLILVDVFDNPIGTADKRRAHTVPLLHRAFSVIVGSCCCKSVPRASTIPAACGQMPAVLTRE